MYAARKAVENSRAHKMVNEFWSKRTTLKGQAVIDLALALREIGRTEDSIALLEQQGGGETDAMGTLAGNLKRRWLLEGRVEDGNRALSLYRQAFEIASTAGQENWPQAFYHGINVAFMQLVFCDNAPAARAMADEVLKACAKAPADKWRLATEGEAHLLRGDTAAAQQAYQNAILADRSPTTREIDAMYGQAMLIMAKNGTEQTHDSSIKSSGAPSRRAWK
jgi:hypothetical protein